jgi:hypothetical protein
MLPEVYFLRYAFPCARVLVDVRKTITEEDWLKLKKAVETDTPITRERLEQIFPVAIERLKKISANYWNIAVIREYFWNKHEEAISRDLPAMIKRLCPVCKGKIIKQTGDVFKVDLGNNDIRNVNALYNDAKVGDTVMVHYGYAVEKI